MNKEKYKQIVKKNIKKDNVIKNYIYAFVSGGIFGFTAELIYKLLKCTTIINEMNIKSYISLAIIFISSFLTSIGIFDKLVKICRSGLIIPTSGFAHSVTSSAIDYKKEGLITGIGSNFFLLAGSVILYSIISSFILIILKVIIYG